MPNSNKAPITPSVPRGPVSHLLPGRLAKVGAPDGWGSVEGAGTKMTTAWLQHPPGRGFPSGRAPQPSGRTLALLSCLRAFVRTGPSPWKAFPPLTLHTQALPISCCPGSFLYPMVRTDHSVLKANLLLVSSPEVLKLHPS